MSTINLESKKHAEVIRQLIDNGVPGGFGQMNILPKSCDKAKKFGIEIKGEQPYIAMCGLVDGKQYIASFLDSPTVDHAYAVLWKCTVETTYYQFLNAQFVNIVRWKAAKE